MVCHMSRNGVHGSLLVGSPGGCMTALTGAACVVTGGSCKRAWCEGVSVCTGLGWCGWGVGVWPFAWG